MRVLMTNGKHSVFIDEDKTDDWYAQGYYLDDLQIQVEEVTEATTESDEESE